jgi:hypothetical protein
MPGYITKKLQEYEHARPSKPQNCREDVVAELILMVNPLYQIMSVAMLNYNWCLALRSVLSTSWVCCAHGNNFYGQWRKT